MDKSEEKNMSAGNKKYHCSKGHGWDTEVEADNCSRCAANK